MVINSRIMRKEWQKIPRGICSLPLTFHGELREHFRNLRERGLSVYFKEVRITQAARDHGLSKIMREMYIKRAREHIEDELTENRLRLVNDSVLICRVKGGFIVWAIGVRRGVS